jgi:nucleotide-binding universal stress UspA family protein
MKGQPMIKTILASAGSAGDAATLAAALAIARPFGAHLDVLHVRLDATSVALAMATDVGSGALTAGLIERLEADAQQREAEAKETFSRFCQGAGLAVATTPSAAAAPSAEWHVETGEEANWMTRYGMTADLIVASRASGEEAAARTILEAVLLETGRPLLIPAAAPVTASIERIAIAWKPTREAARAVALAMPFLARAKEILVLTVAEEPPEEGGVVPDDAAPLVRNLAWHGLAARAERLRPGEEGAAATLLAAASERADLLVMGGYGHGRLREWVFGGFTQQVLVAAPLPVLLSH